MIRVGVTREYESIALGVVLGTWDRQRIELITCDSPQSRVRRIRL